MEIKQITKKQAKRIYESKIWEDLNDEEIVILQLFQKYLCVNFSRFAEALENVLECPLQTFEFTNKSRLIQMYVNKKKEPSISKTNKLISKLLKASKKKISNSIENTIDLLNNNKGDLSWWI